MNTNIDFGMPETLVLCGSYLLANGHFGLGVALLSLGFLGSIFRSALRIQKAQQELEAKQKLLSEASDAGEEIGAVIASIVGALGSEKKKSPGGPIN